MSADKALQRHVPRRPMHERGISPVPGIYFLGFPWLHSRKSGIIHGIDEDARYIAEAIAART